MQRSRLLDLSRSRQQGKPEKRRTADEEHSQLQGQVSVVDIVDNRPHLSQRGIFEAIKQVGFKRHMPNAQRLRQ